MKITSADFETSAFAHEGWPAGSLPEIAFLGRSNVGKSSLINSLLGRTRLARTSSTPGRTQSLNFFQVNRRFRFVDFPGFGYAKASAAARQAWAEMATSYLANRDCLVLSIHVVDSRHEPSAPDLQLREWLQFNRKPFVVVITKSDKLSKNELQKSKERALRALEVGRVVPYSAASGLGRKELWHAIEEAVTAYEAVRAESAWNGEVVRQQRKSALAARRTHAKS